MEDSLGTVGTKNKNPKIRRMIILSIIALAIIAILVSAFTIMNPQGIQVADNETDGIVVITDKAVTPEVVNIRKGDTVEWMNRGEKPHKLSVTSANPPQELDGFGLSDPLLKDETYSFTFDVSGSFTYEDPDNPDVVKGTVIVE